MKLAHRIFEFLFRGGLSLVFRPAQETDPEGGILSIPEPVEGGTESTESLGFLDSLTGSRAALVRAEEEIAALAQQPTQETDPDGDLPNDVPLTGEGYIRQARDTDQ